MTVWIYIKCGTGGAIRHLEIFSNKPTFDLEPYSLLFEANMNGGDSLLVGRRDE